MGYNDTAGRGVTNTVVNTSAAGSTVLCLPPSSLPRYVIQQVPSLKLFRHGIIFPYEGPAQTTGVPGESEGG